MKALGFSSEHLLHKQIQYWARKSSDFSMVPVYRLKTGENSMTLVFKEQCDAGIFAELLDGVNVLELEPQDVDAEIHISNIQPVPLLLSAGFIKSQMKQQPDVYLMISSQEFEQVCNILFLYGHFEAESISLMDGRTLVKVNRPVYYLLYKLEEEHGVSVFWRDNTNTYYPWGFALLSGWIFQDDTCRMVTESSIEIIKETEFSPLLPNVQFEHDFHILTALDKLPYELKLPVTILPHEDRRNEPTMWFYEGEQGLKLLEHWFKSIPAQRTIGFSLCRVTGEQNGFLLKATGKEAKNMATPKASKSFISVCDSPECWLQTGFRLAPPLPGEKLAELLDAGIDDVYFLYSSNGSCEYFHMSQGDFEPLDHIVYHVMEANRSQIRAFRGRFSFQDEALAVIQASGMTGSQPETREENKQEHASFQEVAEESVTPQEEEIHIDEQVGEGYSPDELIAEIQQLRFLILQNPELDNSGNWLRLGMLEGNFQHHSEAIQCLELGIFFEQMSGKWQRFGPVLFKHVKNLYGEVEPESLFEKKPDSLTLEETEILGFLIYEYGEKYADFYNGPFLLALENHYNMIPPVRLVNFLDSLVSVGMTQSYMALKIKDHVMSHLFEVGVFAEGHLPAFIAAYGKVGDEEWLELLESSLNSVWSVIQKENNKQAQNHRFIFHLACAYGKAHFHQVSESSSHLNQAERIVTATRQEVHRALFHVYKERCDCFIRGVDFEPTSQLKELLSNCGPIERYQVDRLLAYIRTGSEFSLPDESTTEYFGLKLRTNKELSRIIPDILVRVQREDVTSGLRHSYRRKQAYIAISDLLPRLGEQLCFHYMEELFTLQRTLEEVAHRGQVLAALLKVAWHFEKTEWIHSLDNEVLGLLESIDISIREEILLSVLKVLVGFVGKTNPDKRYLQLMDTVITSVQPSLEGGKLLLWCSRYYSALADLQRSRFCLGKVIDFYFERLSAGVQRFELLTTLFSLERHCDAEQKIWILDAMIPKFEKIEDHYSTNDYYSLSKVLFLEFLFYSEREEDAYNDKLQQFLNVFENNWKRAFLNNPDLRRLIS